MSDQRISIYASTNQIRIWSLWIFSLYLFSNGLGKPMATVRKGVIFVRKGTIFTLKSDCSNLLLPAAAEKRYTDFTTTNESCAGAIYSPP